MIVYQASKRQFIRDTFEDDIEFLLSQQFLLLSVHRQHKSSRYLCLSLRKYPLVVPSRTRFEGTRT